MIARRAFLIGLVVALTVPSAWGLAREVEWDELRPRGPAAAGSEAPVEELGGRDIVLSGFLLPVDREGDLVYEFLLVPWAGACSHAAQPPPNQVIRVTPQAPLLVSGSYEPVSVAGRLRTGIEATQLFIMDGVVTVRSGYAIGLARVERLAAGPEKAPGTPPNPWKSLTR